MKNGFASISSGSISNAEIWKSTAESFGDGIWWYFTKDDKLEVSDNWRKNLNLPGPPKRSSLRHWLERIVSNDQERVSGLFNELLSLKTRNLNIVYNVHDQRNQSFEILHRLSVKEVDDLSKTAAVVSGLIIPNGPPSNFQQIGSSKEPPSIRDELLRAENAERTDTVGSWKWNVVKDTQTFDKNYRTMLGYTEEELPDGLRAWQKVVFREDAIQALLDFETHLASKGTLPCVNICRYRHKTGKTLYIKSRAKVTKWSDDGKPLIVEGIHMDVTTEHEAHRELERLRLILEQTNRTAKVGGWQYTPEANELIWTKTTYNIHEIDTENSPTIDIARAISFYKEGSSRERIEEIFKSALAGPFSYNEELQIITAKGNERWIRAQGISEFKNGKCVRMYGSFQDIHENKIADLRLKTEEAKFRELYESSPVAICKNCFKTGRFLDINHAAHLLLGYSIDELRTRDYQDITPEEYADADKIQNEILVSHGRFGPFEKEYFRKDGSRCEVQVTGFYVESEDGEPITWALIQDIGERKKTERSILEAMKAAEKANYAKSAFLAAMSHEIRTPLNGIIGSTELLSETDIDESQQALIQMILNSGDVLLSTISDVLDYSKIEAGQMQLEESPFSPLEVAEQVLDIMTPKARAAGIEMGVSLGEICPEMLLGDAVRIRQILINFVGNAVKFTHEGYVEVGIDYREPEGLKLSVRDTGIGICEEKIKEIFKPFTQADLSTTRKYGGSGLGLAICKSLANLMGGKIQIESVEGEGSIFSLSIPLKSIGSPKTDQSSKPKPLAHRKGLIIESTPFSNRLIRDTIRGAGGDTLEAADYQAAQSIIQKKTQVDFIIAPVQVFASHAPSDSLADHPLTLFDIPIIAVEDNRSVSNSALSKGKYLSLERPLKTNQIIRACKAAIQIETARPALPRPESTPANQVSRVLIVEDNFTNKALLERMLQKLNVAKIDHAENGQIAVDLVTDKKNSDYDIIFMDCQMPVMSGYEATISIRDFDKTRPTKRKNRIIGVSAGAMEGDAEHAIGVGMDDYITKPFRIDSIRKALEECFSR